LGFSVLRFWLFFRSVFRFLGQKTSVFRFWCSSRFAGFSFFSIRFSVFVIGTSGFSVLVSDVVVGFSYFVLFVAAKCHGKGSQVSNDAQDFGHTISNVPLASATEKEIVDYVAFFFTRRGKATKISKENTLR